MIGPSNGQSWPSLDEFVDAYESARARGEPARPRGIPAAPRPPANTWRSSASWSGWTWNIAGRMAAPIAWTTTAAGSPSCSRTGDGCRRSPSRSSACAAQAGEDPSPLEYRRRFGADTLDWPSSFLDSLDGESRRARLGPPRSCPARGDEIAGDVASRPRPPIENTARDAAAMTRQPGGRVHVARGCTGTGRAVPRPRPVGLEPGGPRGAGRDGLPRRWAARSSASGSSPSWGAGPSAASTWPARGTSPIGPSP